MENTVNVRFARVRGNKGLLIFLSTAAVIVVLWVLIAGISWASDPGMYDWGEGLLVTVVAPLIVAPIASGLAMVLAALSQKKGAGFILFFVTGLVAPFVALILVALGTLIANKLYIGPESEPAEPYRGPAEADSEPAAEARRPAWSPQSRI